MRTRPHSWTLPAIGNLGQTNVITGIGLVPVYNPQKMKIRTTLSAAVFSVCIAVSAAHALPVLTDGFTDGDRTNGADTQDTNWYTIGASSSAASIVNDNVTNGINLGNAVRLQPTTYGQGWVAQMLAPVTLSDGASLTFSFRWRFTSTTNLNQAGRLRWGLYNSNGTLTASDAQATVRNNDAGFYASTNPGGASATGTGLGQETASNDEILLGGGTSVVGSAGASISGGTTAHTATITLTRSGGSLVMSGSVDGQAAATATVTTPATFTFDEIAISTGIAGYTTAPPLLIDEVVVDSAGSSLLNLSSAHDFAAPANITASAASELTGLSTLAAFRATPLANRYVYSFETWPEATNALGLNEYTFRFDLDGNGSSDQQVRMRRAAGFTIPQLTKVTNGSASSPSTYLGGLGEIGWNGPNGSIHTFDFTKPVAGFGVVYRSPSNARLFKSDSYPLEYVLADGTLVRLGASGVLGATIAANTNTFVGIVDPTGIGITSVTIRTRGTLTSASQQIFLDDMAFIEMPEPTVAAIANLNGSREFSNPAAILGSASTQLSGLCSLDQFRALTTQRRFVYSFTAWPQAAASLGANTFPFRFDLDGNGTEDQRVTVNYTGTQSSSTFLTKASVPGASSPAAALGGLGDVGGTAYAEHSFTFTKPVFAFGFTYNSPASLKLQRTNGYPVSYTLTNGTVVNLGTTGALGATLSANSNSFVGVIDSSGKGIASVTVRVMGTAAGSQPVYLDDLCFMLDGPPLGDWTLWLNEEFEGTALNTQVWSTGYRYLEVINDELQGFVPENVTVENGMCRLKIEKRTVQNTDMAGNTGATKDYASGAIQTYNKWSHGYGYYEARLRMPEAIGTWPAFWLLPDRGPGYANLDQRVTVGNTKDGVPIPMGNEFDVTEFFSAWKDSATGLYTSHSGYFWRHGTNSLSWGDYAKNLNGNGPSLFYYPNATSEFHTYGMRWSPGKVTFYIDGRPVLEREDAATIAVCPHYLILNVSLWQNLWRAGTATMAQIDADLATPKYLDIDYVKVWVDNTLPTPSEFILDNWSASGVQASNVAQWSRWVTTPTGFYGKDYMHDGNAGKGTKWVKFSPTLFQAGNYEVFGWWPMAATGNASNVPVEIVHTGGTANVTVNQQTTGGGWVSLGTYSFNAGAQGSVTFRNNGTTGRVCVDAVRFQLVP